MKGLLLVGHEKVLRGFGLRTGDRGSDTADGAGNHGRPTSQTQITGKYWGPPEPQTFSIFVKYSTPDWLDWAKRGRKECLCLWVF